MRTRVTRSAARHAFRAPRARSARPRTAAGAGGQPAARRFAKSVEQPPDALRNVGILAHIDAGKVCHYMTQPLVGLCGDCVVVLKVSWCGVRRGQDDAHGAHALLHCPRRPGGG